MLRRNWSFLLLVLVGCSLAYAASFNRVPTATFATAAAACGTDLRNLCVITDCIDEDCAAGSGSVEVLTYHNGTAFVPVTSSVGAGNQPGVELSAIFCGDLPNNTTNYTSPITGYPAGPLYSDGLSATDLSYALAGTGCAAQDSTTEATADEIMFTGLAAKVHGMYCRVSGSGSNGVVFHARSAAANLTPDITCTIATATTECAVALTTTADIAANATWAVSATSTEDLSAQDYWCVLDITLQP